MLWTYHSIKLTNSYYSVKTFKQYEPTSTSTITSIPRLDLVLDRNRNHNPHQLTIKNMKPIIHDEIEKIIKKLEKLIKKNKIKNTFIDQAIDRLTEFNIYYDKRNH